MVDGQATADVTAGVIGRLKQRMIDHALPLWSSEGWDAAAGGFVDRLHPDGRADPLAPRRVFVQARQIYCYAKAAQMGWYPQGREVALKGLEYLLARAKAPDGRPGYVHRLTPEGGVRGSVGLLAGDTPIAQILKLDGQAGHRATDMVAFRQDLKIGVEIAQLGFAPRRKERLMTIHDFPR